MRRYVVRQQPFRRHPYNDRARPVDLPKYIYPDNVVSAALLGKIAPYVKFEVRASECRRVRKLDNQKRGGVYGGGYLLSDKATARKIEAY